MEAFRNLGGVDALVQKILSGLEESTGQDDHRSGAITGLDVLGLGNFDQHFGCGVDHFHLFHDSSTIVGNEDFAFGVLDHLVHTSGT